MKKLIVIDMQNDFITGVLENDNAKNIKDDVVKYVKERLNDGETEVYFTRDTHDENYLNTTEGKHLPIVHCIKGTHGWELIDELNEIVKENSLEDNIIDKKRFGEKDLYHLVGEASEYTLIGTRTSICVLSNAIILKAHTETEVYVVENLCACENDKTQNAAILSMQTAQINII